MIIHIVRNGEKVSDILNEYNITIDDLKTNNLHITDFNLLLAGTKLRIPTLNQETMQILSETEPLVSSYYDINDEISSNDETKCNDFNSHNDNSNNIKKENNFRGLNILPRFPFTSKKIKRQIYPHFIKKKNDN